jgi:hypothetical protein
MEFCITRSIFNINSFGSDKSINNDTNISKKLMFYLTFKSPISTSRYLLSVTNQPLSITNIEYVLASRMTRGTAR